MEPEKSNLASSAFTQSLPLVGTSFVNKCGAIGLSFLPMILIQNNFSVGKASLAMGVVKTTSLGGAFIGGWACDRLGMKRVLLLSFILSSIGLAILPFSRTHFLIVLAAAIAQLGAALFFSPSRLLLIDMVEIRYRQESMGWLRLANNAGQIISYTLGSLFSTAGLTLLILFDSLTSLLAFFLGIKWLPSGNHKPAISLTVLQRVSWSKFGSFFVYCTLINAGYGFMYELFMVGAAGRYKLLFHEQGATIFSQMMVFNTVLCSVFVIFAAKYIKNPTYIFPFGLVTLACGASIAIEGAAHRELIFIGITILTIGEILFTSLSQYVLIHAMPESKSQGSIYGVVMMVQVFGRILGGILGFPLIVYGASATLVFAVSALSLLIIIYLARQGFRDFAKKEIAQGIA